MATAAALQPRSKGATGGIFGAISRAVRGQTLPSVSNSRRSPSASYMRDTSAGFLSSWRPAVRDAEVDVRSSWTLGAARAIDSMHNSGWLAGAIEQASADTIGSGLRLNSTPDYEAIGWSQEYAREWSRRVERRWRAWSSNPIECDARGKRTIADMTDSAIRYHYAFGEAVALLPEIRRPHSQSALKVLMVSPHRLTQETNELSRLHQGVFTDGNGLPTAFRFKRRSNGVETDLDIAARSGRGRPQVVHVFDGAPDQVRGMTPMAPVLLRMRQYDQLSDATLTASLIQTIIAATIKSDGLEGAAFEGLAGSGEKTGDGGVELPDETQAYFEAKLDWWKNRSMDLGTHGKIQQLFPGEEFEIHGPKTPTDTYLPFSRNLLREIARCLGMTYEAMTGDYEGATYSSVRMATSAMWFITQRRRARIAQPFVHPIYSAWLEEEIATRRLPFPGGIEAFYRFRNEVTQAEWTGPAKATADDFKSAKAASERLANGTTSLAYECAEYGLDPDSVMEQRAHDIKLAASHGLPNPYIPPNPNAPTQKTDAALMKEDA